MDATPVSPPDGANIRVLTWNVHAGIGPDGRFDLGRIVDLVRRHNPDIVALQEIDSRGKGEVSPFSFLAKALGSHAAEARTIVAPDGYYGHALISRWPMGDVAVHDLSVYRREPRCAIETTITTPYGPLHLASVHLGLGWHERREQAAMLAAIAGTSRRTTILLGDFNDWFFFGSVRRALKTILPRRTMHPTYPSFRPMLRLDRIYCRPADALLKSWTDQAARRISDHLPVIADIRLGGFDAEGAGPQPLSLTEAATFPAEA
ncbi:MAG TPA: endonuclease/exonuclease/phosphatase family protein [Ferrovibrio sp.]|jgi:endonuclease/exonuclease/phosphatase family metal-dependent hydrolase|uniref:endonuclease/exonuclease/phosphatase family protein n=1 Tax=Ferrovibrio sp. TaxID=1917215 RepID=UPI002ED49DFE